MSRLARGRSRPCQTPAEMSLKLRLFCKFCKAVIEAEAGEAPEATFKDFCYLSITMDISRIIDRTRPVLVAVSGGADSVALLHRLVTEGFRCVAAHCNFHLRGQESDSDEAYVRSLCDRLAVELVVNHFDTRAYARSRHISIEMAARDLRYEWFYRLLDERGIPRVAVAHHADDAAETFLLNLTRGTGLRGLAGMKPVQGRVVRPLLDVSRADIELYCRAHGLDFVTDSSNASDDFSRNKIRHHVIPALKSINPSFLSTMGANTAHLAGVLAVFEAVASRFEAEAVRREGDVVSISASALRAAPSAEPFLHWLLSPMGFSPRSIVSMARCVGEGRSGRVFYAAGRRAVVDRSRVIVSPVEDGLAPSLFELRGFDCEVFEPVHVRLSLVPVDDGFRLSRSPLTMHIDASKLSFPLEVRHWRRGDSFVPLGMRGRKKLSDFFVDCKMSLPEKEAAWVVVSAGQIVCVLGRRLDDRFKFTPSCRGVAQLELLG